MLLLHHDPVLGRAYGFQPGQHRFAPLAWIVASGSPENRTRRHLFIGQVWATSPRLPRANVVVDPVGMAGLEPAFSCSQSTRVSHYPTSRKSVRTAGFEPAISWSPTRRDSQASLRSATSGSCGSRTRLCALKGRDPRSDRRTSRVGAHLPRRRGRGWRARRSQWAGRCSNPRLRLFRPPLYRLSYQPNKKTRRRF